MTRLAVWASVCAGVIGAARLPLDAVQFRSGTELVLIDVEVTRDGRPVERLSASDFELHDQGVRQTIREVSVDAVPVSLLLTLDVSGSVADGTIQQLKAAAAAAIDALGSADTAALTAFADSIALLSDWTSERRPLASAIDGLRAEGATALYDAVFASLMLRPAAPRRMLLLIFSDGIDTTSWLDAASVLAAARRTDVVVYAVSSTEAITRDDARLSRAFDRAPTLFPAVFLRRLADDCGGVTIDLNHPTDLPELFHRIVREFKQRYVISYSPQGVRPGGWHEVVVSLPRHEGLVRARRGYWR